MEHILTLGTLYCHFQRSNEVKGTEWNVDFSAATGEYKFQVTFTAIQW